MIAYNLQEYKKKAKPEAKPMGEVEDGDEEKPHIHQEAIALPIFLLPTTQYLLPTTYYLPRS